MNIREIKKLLSNEIEINDDFYDFCIECLKKIYGDNSNIAINDFNESLDAYQYNGCIQSLVAIDNNVKRILKEREEMSEKRKTVYDN
jgi:hypothetical protein